MSCFDVRARLLLVSPTREFPPRSDGAQRETASERTVFHRAALGMCRVQSSPARRTKRQRSLEQPGPKGNAQLPFRYMKSIRGISLPRGASAFNESERADRQSVWIQLLPKERPMSPLRCFCVALVLSVPFPSLLAGEHHTLRYLYEDSRIPISARSLDISPDSKEAALGLEDGVVHFIRLADGEQTAEVQALPFDMKYCRDGSRILMLSEYESFTLSTSTRARTKVETSDVPGFLGLLTINRNGKLIIDSTVDGSPAQACKELQPGDEIVSMGDGKSGEMLDVVGLPSAQFAGRLKGPVGTYVRISVLRKNGETTQPILLRRSPATVDGNSVRFAALQKQTIGESLLHFQRDNRHTFSSAFDGKSVCSLNTEDIQLIGQHAVAPNQTLFAVLSFTVQDREKFGIEIYDLTTIERKVYIPFNRPSFNSIAFSSDSCQLFAASHNRVDVYDVETGSFDRGLVGNGDVVNPTPTDKKAVKSQAGTIGHAVSGAARDSVGEFHFTNSKQHVEKIAVSQSLVAVAIPGGSLELWDVQSGNIRTSIAAPTHGTRQYMTPKVDLMQFSPDGDWLVYYIEGILNIVDVSEISKPSTVSQKQ